MLGADIGSTIVVQALSFKTAALVPLLLLAGVGTLSFARTPFGGEVGRILIGLALMIVSLGMIVAASQPLRENGVFLLIMERLADDAVLALVLGALLTWLAHSSVAVILLVMSLAATGVLTVPLALAFVLGANVGSGLIPLGLALRSPAAAKRCSSATSPSAPSGRCWGSLLLLRACVACWARPAGRSPSHTGFNRARCALPAPSSSRARLLERFVTDRAGGSGSIPSARRRSATGRPAIGNATARGACGSADTVELMLRETILTFQPGHESRRSRSAASTTRSTGSRRPIKLYLTRLTRQPLDEEDCAPLLRPHPLHHQPRACGRHHRPGPARARGQEAAPRGRVLGRGLVEITALHQRVVDQMRLAVSVFVTRDVAMAKTLVVQKDAIRAAERAATESHFQRLRDGTVASIETSALHLDILRDLKRIAAHLTSVALPILEANGALRTSRLVTEDGETTAEAVAVS
jgi:phosphate:Na+ symporter